MTKQLFSTTKKIRNRSVVTQPWNFILSAKFPNRFHIVLETIFRHFGNHQFSQNFPHNQVVVIGVLATHGVVYCFRK